MGKESLKKQEALQQEKIDATVSSAEAFLNGHKKTIYSIIGAIVVVGLAILAYRQFIYNPQEEEALDQSFKAEYAFSQGDFDVALNGDGNNLGFADIISEYGGKSGKDVYFYAGICELQAGNYENAISYLKKYKGKDKILKARAFGCIGDAYVGLEDYQSALTFFDKATKACDNALTPEFLLKAAAVCEELGQNDKALANYKLIKDQYPQSLEAYDIDKYITRIENK